MSTRLSDDVTLFGRPYRWQHADGQWSLVRVYARHLNGEGHWHTDERGRLWYRHYLRAQVSA